VAYELPPLPYPYTALEPFIDETTLHIHHDKHHQAYVTNLNAAVEKHPELFSRSLDDLVRNLASVPEDIRTPVRRNAGQVYNHTMYWDVMGASAGGPPTGAIAEVITGAFGDFETFKTKFTQAAVGQFGSGWAWLVKDTAGHYAIEATSNEGCPLMDGKTPLLVVDVCEHAYYLKYQNKRADFVGAWWNVINWDEVAKRMS
jgi:superoxide dismutase, Fe-Mn family